MQPSFKKALYQVYYKVQNYTDMLINVQLDMDNCIFLNKYF